MAFDSNDRFCLDGQRLVVAAGVYGEAGSEYRTELESFAKITAVGVQAGGGPASFVVKTKDGLTLEFGNGGNSSLLVAGKSPAVTRIWAVNKISDGKGNTQSISYAQSASGQFYPASIDYTSNVAAGVVAANRVEFDYQSRPDATSGYQGGYRYAADQRLSRVVTKTGGAVVSTYVLTYASGITGPSRLASIARCAPTGQCTPATEFGYGGPPAGSVLANSVAVTQTESSVQAGRWYSFDTDGDGRTDLVHLAASGGTYRVWRSLGGAQFSVSQFNAAADTALNLGKWIQIDVNGDGLIDLMHLEATPGSCKYWKSKGDGSFDITSCVLAPDDIGITFGGVIRALNFSEWLVADVNADGRADLIHVSAAQGGDGDDARMRSYISNGDGTFSSVVTPLNSRWNFLTTTGLQQRWMAADINGDGLQDLVYFYSSNVGSSKALWLARQDGTFQEAPYISQGGPHLIVSPGAWYPIDVNGDGLLDLVGIHASSNQVVVELSKGDGTFIRSTVSSPVDSNLGSGTWQIIDANGDGLADLIHTYSNLTSGYLYVWRSRGDGTFDVVLNSQNGDLACSSNCTAMLPGDFEGSGATAFVRLEGASVNDASTVKSVWLMGSAPQSLLTSANNGLGGRSSWRYDVLPKMLGTSYSRELSSNAGGITVTTAIPVVSSAESAVEWNQLENRLQYGLRRTTYSYDSARFDRRRGFVGFAWIQSQEADTGLMTRSYFGQSFPYVGMVTRIGRGKGAGTDGWRNLSDTAVTLACRSATDASTCVVAAGSRYFPYVKSTSTQSWDLDGTALPRTSVVNETPDAYGNFTKVTKTVANSDGTPSGHSVITNYQYFNSASTWIIGRLIKREVIASGPDDPAPVVPGSGGLPPARSPVLPPQVAGTLTSILQLLLMDD